MSLIYILADPEAPRILSELKISGFLEYLHFYGEDRLLGIGMEADENTGAQKGLKLSMFDISDPGARYMLRVVVEYLEKGNYVSAPCWDPENLMLCAANSGKTGNCGQKIDAGGRPIG